MPWAKIQDRFSSQRVQESSTHRSTTRQPKRGGGPARCGGGGSSQAAWQQGKRGKVEGSRRTLSSFMELLQYSG